MRKILAPLTVVTLFLILFPGISMAQFGISGEFRMRGEYRDGYQSLRDSSKTPYGTILGRARILFDYKNEKITTRFSLYDAFVFGQNNYSSDTITKNTVNVYEAFFRYRFSKIFSLHIGRTELIYDDERFIGSSNWVMWGATHDVLIGQWELNKIKYRADIAIAMNNTAPATPYLTSYLLKNYKYMAFLYQQKKFMDDKLTLSFLGLVDAFQKASTAATSKSTKNDTLAVKDPAGNIIGYTVNTTTTTITKTIDYPDHLYARFTLGLDGWLNLKKWNFFLSGYYQGGHYKDGRKINSNFYTAYVSYQIVKPLKLLVGFEHLGGNDFSDTTEFKSTVKGFSTLYGTGHRFYGYMDLFSGLIRDNLSTGLNDLYGRATLTFFKNQMTVEGTCRWFSIPHEFLFVSKPKPGGLPYVEVEKSLGTEIDLMYTYKPMPNLEMNAAYCVFLPTSTMEMMSGIKPGNSKFAQFAYLMIAYKPNFFTSEKK